MAKRERTDPKLSDTLMRFARPIIESMGVDGGSREFQAGLRLSMLVWNAVVLERSGEAPGMVARTLQAFARAGAPRESLATLEAMAAEQRARPQFDTRLMLDLELIQESDLDFRVRVSGAHLADIDAARVVEHLAKLEQSAGRAPGSASAAGGARSSARGKASAARATTSLHSSEAIQTASVVSTGSVQLGAEPWLSLYSRARDVFLLAPWDWLLDDDVFGVRVSGDDEIYWCSVMGAAREFFGIGLYRGDAAFAAFRALRSGEDTDAGVCGFDGFLFSFVDRRILSAREAKAIKASGVRFRGRSAWPQLEEVKFGRLPRPFDAALAPRAKQLLDLVFEGVLAMRDPATRGARDLDGDLPVFEFVNRAVLQRRARPRLVPSPDVPAIDQVAVARLAAKARRIPGAVEFDVFAIEARVGDENGWQYAPVMFAAVEAGSGRALTPNIEPPELRAEACAKNLLAMFEAAGVLPREVRVRRPWVRQVLAPTAGALGVELSLQDELPAIDRLRASFGAMPAF